MHGLTGGSWERGEERATDGEKNNPSGKPRATHGFTTYRRSTPPRQLPTLHQESAPSCRGHPAPLVSASASRQRLRARLRGDNSREATLDTSLAQGPDLQRCLA